MGVYAFGDDMERPYRQPGTAAEYSIEKMWPPCKLEDIHSGKIEKGREYS